MKARHLFNFLFLTLCLMSCKTVKPVLQQQQAVQTISTQNPETHNAAFAVPTLVTDSNLTNAHIGIYVYEPTSKKVIQDYQSNKYFIPASNTKIATCYAAMKYLGDSLFGLMYREENDSTITIQGTGDPTFLHKDFLKQTIFEKLSLYKKIYFDKAQFRTNPLGKGWAWDDYDESYMAERSEFPIYGNLVFADYKGEKGIVKPKFYSNNFRFITQRRIDYFPIKRYHPIDDETVKFILKNESKQYPFSASFPKSFDLLNDTLPLINITKFGSPLTDELPKQFLNLYSQPTDSLLKPMMFNSDNFFAEQTLLMVSLNQLGYMSDEQIIDTLLKHDFANLPQKPRWVDGSGLSRYNLFTPQDFVSILDSMQQNFSWNRITNIFPTGNQGTLKGYYKNYVGSIYAKTGSVSNNFSISGFIKTKAGKNLIFSILVNNFNAIPSASVRQSIEKYLTNIINSN